MPDDTNPHCTANIVSSKHNCKVSFTSLPGSCDAAYMAQPMGDYQQSHHLDTPDAEGHVSFDSFATPKRMDEGVRHVQVDANDGLRVPPPCHNDTVLHDVGPHDIPVAHYGRNESDFTDGACAMNANGPCALGRNGDDNAITSSAQAPLRHDPQHGQRGNAVNGRVGAEGLLQAAPAPLSRKIRGRPPGSKNESRNVSSSRLLGASTNESIALHDGAVVSTLQYSDEDDLGVTRARME